MFLLTQINCLPTPTECLRKNQIVIGFASKGYSDYQDRLGFQTAPENLDFKVELKFQEIEKYEQTNDFDVRCGLEKAINYARATGAAAAAAAALPLLLSVYALCSTTAMRRRSIDATGANISEAGQEGHRVRLELNS